MCTADITAEQNVVRQEVVDVPLNNHMRIRIVQGDPPHQSLIGTSLERLQDGGFAMNPLYISKFGSVPIQTIFSTEGSLVRYMTFLLEIPRVLNENGKEKFLPVDWFTSNKNWVSQFFRREPSRIVLVNAEDSTAAFVVGALERAHRRGLEQDIEMYKSKFGDVPIQTQFDCFGGLERYCMFLFNITRSGILYGEEPFCSFGQFTDERNHDEPRVDFLPSDWLISNAWAKSLVLAHPLNIKVVGPANNPKPVLVPVALEKAGDKGLEQMACYREKYGENPITTQFDCFDDLARYVKHLFDVPDGGDLSREWNLFLSTDIEAVTNDGA